MRFLARFSGKIGNWPQVGALSSLGSLLVKVLLVVNVLFVWLEVWALLAALTSLPVSVPLFYSQPWGDGQLATKSFLVIFPVLSAIILLANLFLGEILWQKRELLLTSALWGLGTLAELLLLISFGRIVFLSSPSLELSLTAKIFLAGSLAFTLAYALSPWVRKFAWRFGMVDDPQTHRHPAILHRESVPRAGALAFFGAFLMTALLFLPLTKHLVGIYLGGLVMVLVGVIDDKYDLNPYLRLGLQVLAALVIVGSGIGITFFRSPFGSIIRLDAIDIPIYVWGVHHLLLLADIFALLWLVWTMNMISWSNGVDGQFSGTVFITFLVLTVLAMRFAGSDPEQAQTAMLAAVAGGAALGLLPFTWHPAKFFWGFGATAGGLLIAALSILSGAKVATAALVLLVPILDAVAAMIRRIARGQSPVWGDREHLHHYLLDWGLSQRQVTGLYYLLTGILGVIALYTAGRTKFLALATVGGVLGFFLVLLNLRGGWFTLWLKKKKEAKANQN